MDPNRQVFSPNQPASPAPHNPAPDSVAPDGQQGASAAPHPCTPQPHNGFQPGSGAGPASTSPTAPLPGTPDVPPAMQSPMGPGPAGMQAANLRPKKSKKLVLFGGIFAALIVVLLGASAAAYYIMMNKPQNVLNMALVNTFSADKVQSISYSGAVDATPKGGTATHATFEGASNNDGALQFTGKFDALVTNLTLDARSVDGESLYLRLGGLDGLAQLLGGATGTDESGFTAFLAPVVSAVNNQWIEINSSMINQLAGTSTDIKDLKLSDADRQKLADAYKKNQFLVVDKALKDEKIGDHDSRHYQVVIDRTKLKGFVNAVKDAKIQNLPMDNDSVKEFLKEIDKANFKKYPVDVWVSKDDKLIRQVSFSTSDDTGKGSIRFTVKDYNKPVNVQKPENSKTLLEIIGQMAGNGGLDSLLNSGGTGSLEDLGSGISL